MLNHERWELRLADNLRRERESDNALVQRARSLNTIEWLGFEFAETRMLSIVLKHFEFLDRSQRGLALNAISAFNRLRVERYSDNHDASGSLFSDTLDDAAEQLFDSIACDLQSQTAGFWEWYLFFLEHLAAEERRVWEMFTFAIMKRKLKPWLARHSAKWPPHVALFRENLVQHRL